VSPSQAFAQWHIDTPFTSLAYRCGGSTGIASFERVPVSRLTTAAFFANAALWHLARFFPFLEGGGIRNYKANSSCTAASTVICEINHI
jgi:hypothetical protein